MSNNEMQVLSDIRERIVRVETKLDSMTDVRATAEEAKEKANEALQYGKSAHHRLNEVADNQRWLWRTVIGALILGAISLLWKGMAV
ncbi:hemolysin XhlA family protein [Brevibacillus porteri]|uniref:Hemolysin XhlA n=1 Tax=Brevibacillus porteri TaxID=2126350 RepID=A0ABX5FJU4_9BACL|nr:hemolysin XhlA family protein [Brevibacillus porteri]MED1801768.1 hemolysin XhlA family protein [Brevibacillus porteri]MED2134899.1 hemolysin XhlA family protein [Brevibacillus porteri]MED2748406.1 hemolysin XhlA family protein [Brevibacillus porteri]MED2818330.1 hemolysin XhlA family protein [Brevibacillus porteri]MED2897711.1 hemolysin XhlA family protein [Brevibacillus porteri]